MNTYSIFINNNFVGLVNASKYKLMISENGTREYKILFKDENNRTVTVLGSKKEVIVKDKSYGLIDIYIEQ